MSEFTDLIAVYSLAIVGIVLMFHVYNLTNQFGERMVAAAQADPPRPEVVPNTHAVSDVVAVPGWRVLDRGASYHRVSGGDRTRGQ